MLAADVPEQLLVLNAQSCSSHTGKTSGLPFAIQLNGVVSVDRAFFTPHPRSLPLTLNLKPANS
jgi:hypothetical protein